MGVEDQKCVACGSLRLVSDLKRGEVICGVCGLVNDQIIVGAPKWESGTSAVKEVGKHYAPLDEVQINSGWSSVIGTGTQDANGNRISPNAVGMFHRLRRINEQSEKRGARNYRKAMSEAKRLVSQLGISQDIVQRALRIYKKAHDANLVRGRGTNGMIAAALYIAARNHGLPIKLGDIEEYANTSKKTLKRCFKVYVMDLKIKADPVSASRTLDKMLSELELQSDTRSRAREILKEISDAKLDKGKNQIVVAACAIYLASIQTGERRTQSQVAKVAQITPVTLRNHFREFVENLSVPDIRVKRGMAASASYFKDPWAL